MKKTAIIIVLALVLCLTLSLAACARPKGRYVMEKVETKTGAKIETIIIADLTDEEKAENYEYTIELELTKKEFIIYVKGEEDYRASYRMDGKKIIVTVNEDIEPNSIIVNGKRIIVSYTATESTSQDKEITVETTYYFIKQ